jgi:hypothetical protein
MPLNNKKFIAHLPDCEACKAVVEYLRRESERDLFLRRAVINRARYVAPAVLKEGGTSYVRVAILLVLAVFFLATPSRGQTQNAPATPQPRSEDTLSKTVVRITATAEGVTDPLNATGFLVAVPDSREVENDTACQKYAG